jgi:RimK family alpha-L-glutamate ligase
MEKQSNKIKIAVFYGGKRSRHLRLIGQAARKLTATPNGRRVDLDLISYNQVCYETGERRVRIRGIDKEITDYGVIFFRTTGKHWEEVDLVIDQISKIKDQRLRPVVVDPMVVDGKPSMAGKAWQMVKLAEAGIPVPRTIYGSLWYLYQIMVDSPSFHRFDFPVILKGSASKGTRVFRANNIEELEKLVREQRKTEIEEGRRYMLQEWIENEGDFRVLVLGEKVLGVMKRSRMGKNEFRNNFSLGGKVEVAELPQKVKQMAVRAAKFCGIMVAGVDIIIDKKAKSNDEKYKILEVNKGPQFTGFMKATGIDTPAEIVKLLMSLKK